LPVKLISTFCTGVQKEFFPILDDDLRPFDFSEVGPGSLRRRP
jgi:hypothetical protein